MRLSLESLKDKCYWLSNKNSEKAIRKQWHTHAWPKEGDHARLLTRIKENNDDQHQELCAFWHLPRHFIHVHKDHVKGETICIMVRPKEGDNTCVTQKNKIRWVCSLEHKTIMTTKSRSFVLIVVPSLHTKPHKGESRLEKGDDTHT
jgi:hypothetical protein